MTEAIAPIRVSGSDVGPVELAAISDVFDRGYLGMGADVKDLETLLSDFLTRPTVCVSTGTAAVQLAVQGCGIGEGDEVLVPSLTYVATYQAISANGAIPVSVDVLDDSLTMDPDDARSKITDRTRALLPVYYGGGIRQLDRIYALADEFGLRVIEDAAHAFGSVLDGALVGSRGDVVCFSFDPIKNLTCGEGGGIVTSDESVLERVRDARLLGVQGDSKARVTERRLYQFDVEMQGWRYHMSNINAAIGKAQFGGFPGRAAHRRALGSAYNAVLLDSPTVQVLPYDYAGIVPHIYPVRFRSEAVRDTVKKRLLEEYSIETALHYFPNHYLTKYRRDGERLPVTESAFARMMTLPLHTKVSVDQVTWIAITVAELSADS